MNKSSEARLAKLMPEFARRVRLIVEALAKRGFDVEVTQGLRTFAEQDALYAQGRTRKGPKVTNAKGGQSLHNYGVAADFALMVNGKYLWPDPHPVWQAIAEEATKARLEAGANWSKPDKPHIEWPDVAWQDLLSIYKEGGLPKVLKSLSPEPVKPKYGDSTEFVKAFQRKHQLTVDGIPGPKTWGALNG